MVVRFLLLVLALSLPFWGLAQFVQGEPLPGLPVNALMTFAPAVAAVILTFRAERASGAKALFARSVDAPRMAGHVAWWPLILLMPAAVFAPPLVGAELAPGTAAVVWASRRTGRWTGSPGSARRPSRCGSSWCGSISAPAAASSRWPCSTPSATWPPSLPMWSGTYDPRSTALILGAVALVLTLARRPQAA